jgi:hypothetical protein
MDCGLIFENCRASFAKTPRLTGIDLVDSSWTGIGPLDPDPTAAAGCGGLAAALGGRKRAGAAATGRSRPKTALR